MISGITDYTYTPVSGSAIQAQFGVAAHDPGLPSNKGNNKI